MLIPRADQEQCIQKLLAIHASGFVSLDMSDTGTGKTLVALELSRHMQLRPFVIVPKAGVSQFRTAAELQNIQVAECRNVEALKTGKYPSLRRATSGELRYLWQLPKDALFIGDEVHKFGGIDSDNSLLLAMLKAYRVHVHLMSATLASTPLRLRAVGSLLSWYTYRPDANFYEWAKRFGCFFNDATARWEFDRTANRIFHLQRLHEALKPFSVRMRIEDIPGFPETEIYPVLVDLNQRDTEEIRKLYADMRQAVRELQAVTAETENLRRRQKVELLKAGVLAEMVDDIVDEGRSAVVFVCFRDTVTALRRLLKERDIESVGIIGGQNPVEREAGRLAFQQNLVHVCVCTVGAGGASINLHDEKKERPRSSLICPDWNDVDTKQCLGRIHRFGGSRSIQRFVLAANTIEESVYKGVMRKVGNMKTINDGHAGVDTMLAEMRDELEKR